jgi:2'-5' RNA ligase
MVGQDRMIRSFVAVELDSSLRESISRVQAQIKEQLQRAPGVRKTDARVQWVQPGSIHLTLKFLGDIEEMRVEEICRTLAKTAESTPSFTVEVGGLGVFPDLRSPRVLWLGLSERAGGQQPVQALTHLAGAVDRALGALGFPVESKPFRPHLTLARIKEGAREVGHTLAESGVMHPVSLVGVLQVKTISLMKSDLRPSGAVYTQLCHAPLRSE